jgi:hypothetical protein
MPMFQAYFKRVSDLKYRVSDLKHGARQDARAAGGIPSGGKPPGYLLG